MSARDGGEAGRINGRFAEVDWVPLRYLNKGFVQPPMPLYAEAQIGLVTPLRDGMNLVAKEYVAAQDPEDPGVLVLSQFAGAANELKAALLVNPYDEAGIAKALNQGLSMPREERGQRHDGQHGRMPFAAFLARHRQAPIQRLRNAGHIIRIDQQCSLQLVCSAPVNCDNTTGRTVLGSVRRRTLCYEVHPIASGILTPFAPRRIRISTLRGNPLFRHQRHPIHLGEAPVDPAGLAAIAR